MAFDDRRLGGRFERERVDVSCDRFVYAAFFDCAVTRHAGSSQLVGCYFTDCTFVGDGWPERFRATPPRRVEVSDQGAGLVTAHECPLHAD